MTITLRMVVPEGARFSCQSCGRCCQGWAVPVDPGTVERLRTHDWGGDPFESPDQLGQPYWIRRVDGRCFFLDGDNLCRIQKELSYEAKPPVCRAFPLSVLEVAERRYARLSFWCPAVVANTGRLLTYQSRWVKDGAALASARTASLSIDGNTEASPRDLDRVHRLLHECVQASEFPMRVRMAAGAAVIRRVIPVSRNGADVAAAVEAARRAGVAALAQEGLQPSCPRAGRRVLALFLLQDREPRRGALVARMLSLMLFNAGLYRLRSRIVKSRASWRQIRGVSFTRSEGSDELLTRYFSSKLDSRRYLEGDASVLMGFNLLLVAYAIVEVMARMRAASAGRAACNDEDIGVGVSAADLLVLEHSGLAVRTAHREAADAALRSPELAGALLAGSLGRY